MLSFIGAIPGIGDLADAANAFLYLKEKDYKNAARSGLCALPFMGELAGVTILAKAPKSARCVRNATRIIGYGATFNWAAEGATDSAVNIYHNIVSGNFFSEDTAKNLVMGGMNAAAMIFSGKQVADSTKDLAKLAKQEVPKILSKVKERTISLPNKNGGFLDLEVLGICKSRGGQSAYQGGSGRKVKTYQTYTKTNPQTGKVYSGRTSGYGTPAENIQKRDANHHMNNKGFGPAILDKSSTNYNAIRGREQMLIEKHGGAISTEGTSGNVINGIGKNNKKKSIYINSAIEEFGGGEE